MSNYRDDRDALRGRVQSLEDELATSRRELEESRRAADGARVEELERRMVEARRVIDGLQGELDALRPKRRAPPAVLPVTLAVIGAVFTGAVMLAFIRVGARPPPPPVAMAPTTHLAPATAPTTSPVEPEKAVTPPTRPRRTEVARWSAKVTRATGAAPTVGATCSIEAKLGGDGASLDVEAVEVVCGDTVLYRSTDALEGVSMTSSNVEEEPGPGDAIVYAALRWDDKGARTGARSQVSIASARRAASVWTDTAPGFHVDLAVEPRSAPTKGPALHDGTRLGLRAQLVVTATSGAAPVKSGATCTLVTTPQQPKCALRIDCGAVALYGADGSVAPCTLADGRVATASDPEGSAVDRDPALSLDVKAQRARVWDGEGARAWTVDLGFR